MDDDKNEVLLEVQSFHRDVNEKLDLMNTRLQRLESGFPGGDVEGHARYHQSLIDDMQVRKDLAKAIKEKTISGLIWVSILWAGSHFWEYVVSGVQSLYPFNK